MGFLPFLIKAPALATLIAVGGSGIVPSVPAASRGSVTGLTITSGVVRVKAGGHAWDLSILALQAGGTLIAAQLTRTSAAGTEFHAWEVTPRSAVVTKIPGGWRIDPKAAAVAPVLSVNLRFTITGHSQVRCSKGSATRYTGMLAGRLILATHLRRLGTVGSKSITFSKPNIAEVDHGCMTRRSPPCPPPGYTWFGSTSPKAGVTDVLGGSFSRGENVIGLGRLTRLAKPAHAQRVDAATASGGTLTVTGSTLQATTGSGSLLSGSATLTGNGTPNVTHSACWLDGHKHIVTDQNFGNTTVATSLVAHTLGSGTISTPTSGVGTFDKITIS